jgi:chlorobactene glucosyltransferase
MLELVISCLWLGAVAWLVARALRQRSLLEPVGPRPAPSVATASSVAIVVPARDEASNIERCLHGLLAQDYPTSRLTIVVVDDDSTDNTLAIARSIAFSRPQLTVLRCPPVPARWIGKSWACWAGAAAVSAHTDWLCFVDADVRAEPALVAAAVAAAETGQLDLLSLSPRQLLGSFAERLVMPCGLYLLAFCQDLNKVQGADARLVTATGQFMLVRRSAYEAVGGHAAVSAAVCEDVALALLVKQSGRRVRLKDGGRVLTTRMYSDWSTLWVGVSKNLVEMFGGPGWTIAIAMASVVLAWAAWLVPALDAVGCSAGRPGACLALAPAIVASAAAIGLHVAGAIHFRIPAWYGLLFPLGYTAGAAMAIDSVRRRWRGKVRWKGRTCP